MKSKRNSGKINKIIYTLPMIIIMILTLLLLSFVGFGEAKRKYTLFQIDKMITQAGIVDNALDAFLKSGLPIEQFSGFSSIAQMLLKSDYSIDNIVISNSRGETVFSKLREGLSGGRLDKTKYLPYERDKKYSLIKVEESDESFRVTGTLENKFGVAGFVYLEAPKEKLLSFLNLKYINVFISCAVLSILFILIVIFYEMTTNKRRYRQKIYQFAYISFFLILSSIIAYTVFSIYKDGAKASTKALSDSMAQRLSAIMELNIDINDIKGIDDAFKQYKESNPEINAIAITENGIAISHTDPEKIGVPYKPSSDSLEYVNVLKRTDEKKSKEFRVAVTMPTFVITNAILGSSKAFIVLFIACILISLIFLNAGSAILEVMESGSGNGEKGSELRFSVGLNLIKPAYFLIVFVNALSISFLPQLVSDFAARADSDIASASLPFTIYYLCFALVLVPAGQYAEKGNLKKLMAAGFIAEFAGLLMVALSKDYWFLTIGRSASGIGQGFFLIGLQSYVLAITPKNKKSLGHAVKVIGRNSGLIAGTAIGALLYSFLNYRGLFILASIISMSALIYMILLVPGEEEVTGEKKVVESSGENALTALFKNILEVIKDFEFMKTLLSIGVVGKMSIAGVVMFAVPLLLSQKGFATEDIGLALMLYYIFGMLTTHYATKIVDRPGATRWVLSGSAVIGGVSSLFLGFIGIKEILENATTPGIKWLSHLAVNLNSFLSHAGSTNLESYIILFFIVLIGVSNGLLAAPIMTHIGNAKIAERCGVKTVSATYVFLERFGHVTGPSIIGYLIVVNQNSTLAISFFGLVTIAFGILFAVLPGERRERA